LSVKVAGKNIYEMTELSIKDLRAFLENIEFK